MKHRIFIAINLPKEIKKSLANFQSKWPGLPARWVKSENLHITLVFLGYVLDEEIPEILKITEEIAQKNNSFSINLNKICYAPPRKTPPRMIWAAGEKSEELGKLQQELENSFFASQLKGTIKKESRSHSSHITLARIRQWEFRRIEPEERPEISEDISLSFLVESIEVMESKLKRGGAEYAVLESIPLTIYQ